MVTKESLENYLLIPAAIRRIDRKITYYQNHPLQTTYGSVKGSMPNFPYAECHFAVGVADAKDENARNIKVQQLMIDLLRNKKKYEDMKLEIELFIESITDLELKEMFNMRYIDLIKTEDIAKHFGYERTLINKKIVNYLEKQKVSHNSHN